MLDGTLLQQRRKKLNEAKIARRQETTSLVRVLCAVVAVTQVVARGRRAIE